jgi:DNA-binding IclR family transcriptional regulator
MQGEAVVVSKITIILEMLGDGKWHEIEELQQRRGLNEHEVQEITAFLNKYDFVKIDKEHRKVKINRNFQKLLVQTVT